MKRLHAEVDAVAARGGGCRLTRENAAAAAQQKRRRVKRPAGGRAQ